MGTEYLVQSLKVSLGKSELKNDLRFKGGTEYGTSFTQWGPDAYGYKPLPTVYRPDEPHLQGKHLHSRSGIFPRLHGSVEEVKAKLVPAHTTLTLSLKAVDPANKGFLSTEAVQKGLKGTGVFLSQADVDTFLNTIPRNEDGDLDYKAMLDVIIGKGAPAAALTASPPVPQEFTWSDDDGLQIPGLRLHSTSRPFNLSATALRRLAQEATKIRKSQHDAEKVHDLLRNFLLQDLIVDPGPLGHPDLSFREWLIESGVLARRETLLPGVIPPEVYEVFDLIISALGVPTAVSAIMTPTALGSSLKRSTTLGSTLSSLKAAQ
jgi:hypothetical protein